MPTDHRAALKKIRTFPSLVRYLRDEMGWPIDNGDFEELTFEYTPEELGIDSASAAKIQEIKRLRPLSPNQPWGIFFIKFEPRKLPVVALRRVLSRVALKKRASANSAERAAWAADDLLFVSNFGEGDERQISFAHFSQDGRKDDLPTLKVLGWDNLDTPLHLDHVAELLTERLVWPHNDKDVAGWRESWRSAFTLRHREVIDTSKTLAERLAELARAIRDRIKTVLAIETTSGAVTTLMKAFQHALVHDLDDDGFADMYAQTITYGLLSARVTNPGANTADGLAVQLPVTNPFLKELMETFLHVGGRNGKAGKGLGIDFDELGVSEVVELLDDANMDAVVRDFGDRNPEEDPIIHFYEHFLAAYDKKQKVSRGVFYTPRPVVSYIVRSVDEVLRIHFGLEDGLADTTTWREMAIRFRGLKVPDGTDPGQAFVQILDPATGTGTFLVEVIDRIHRGLEEKWRAAGHDERSIATLWNRYVPQHLLPRLYGYELLMAPYAIAHLKIGLKLYETGYRFGSDERARIYLTNALEPTSDDKRQMEFTEWIPALAHEARAVNEVKRGHRFTVVTGNPPYSNFGQLNKNPFILSLLEDYKRGLGERKSNITDDFIKFVRFSQHLIQLAGAGILGLITNNVFIDGLTHRRMRESLIESFPLVWVLDLHGSVKKRDIARDGSKDENVFDIQQGVGVSVWARTWPQTPKRARHSSLLGTRASKYTRLSGAVISTLGWTDIQPSSPRFLLCPSLTDENSEYLSWIGLKEVFRVGAGGLETMNDPLTITFSSAEMRRVIADLGAMSPSEFRKSYQVTDSAGWSLQKARADVVSENAPADLIREICYRPFDVRWTFYSGKQGFLSRPRPDLFRHLIRSGSRPRHRIPVVPPAGRRSRANLAGG